MNYHIEVIEVGAIGKEIVVMGFETTANAKTCEGVTATEGALVHGSHTIGEFDKPQLVTVLKCAVANADKFVAVQPQSHDAHAHTCRVANGSDMRVFIKIRASELQYINIGSASESLGHNLGYRLILVGCRDFQYR